MQEIDLLPMDESMEFHFESWDNEVRHNIN